MDYKDTDRQAVDAAMRKAYPREGQIPARLRELLRRLSESDRDARPERG